MGCLLGLSELHICVLLQVVEAAFEVLLGLVQLREDVGVFGCVLLQLLVVAVELPVDPGLLALKGVGKLLLVLLARLLQPVAQVCLGLVQFLSDLITLLVELLLEGAGLGIEVRFSGLLDAADPLVDLFECGLQRLLALFAEVGQ